MKKKKYLIIGLIFLILSATIIYSAKINFIIFPTQELELSNDLELVGLTKGLLIVQEMSVKKDYLSAVELAMASTGLQYLNENILMVMDANYQLLYKTTFTNENLGRPQYKLFKFPEKVYVGKEKKVIVCLSTSAGDKDSHLSLLWTKAGKLGKLTAKTVTGEDIIGNLKNTGKEFTLEGNIGLRTYESNYGHINWSKIFLLFLSILVSLLIIWIKKVEAFITQITIAPEIIYVILAIVFGFLLVFLTPPLQAPDEIDHLNRSYQLSELNVLQTDSTIPVSIMKLFDDYAKMNYDTFRKNSVHKILAEKQVELNPQVRTTIFIRPFIFPYVPQALGIFIGKMFNTSPITLLYIGRIFNLLFSVFLIYLAIRNIPFGKWTLFLLGLMPMTLFLCSSLSKDAMIVSMSFLVISVILRMAYDSPKEISTKSLSILFALSFLVAASRSVYGLLIGMFLLIPVERIGSLKKYLIVFASLIVTVLMATQTGTLQQLMQSRYVNKTQITVNNSEFSNTLSTRPPTAFDYFKKSDRPNIVPEGINRNKQKQFILNNPVQYLGIIFNSVFDSERTFILNSFVGIMGWYRHLPSWHINLYLCILLITALFISGNEIKITLKKKLILAAILIAGVIAIETGIYLGWNPVGQKNIIDVQGRYFIPIAPLLFLLLYNTFVNNNLKLFWNRQQNIRVKSRQKSSIKQISANLNNGQKVLYNSLYLIIVCFTVISLLTTIYVVFSSYYIVLI